MKRVVNRFLVPAATALLARVSGRVSRHRRVHAAGDAGVIFDAHIHVQPWHMVKPEALALNDWLRNYARTINAKFADYAAAFVDAAGNVKPELAKDEVHPSKEGYALMRPIVEAALK